MVRFGPSETFINLHIPAPAEQENLARTPEAWANILIVAALESKPKTDIRRRLAIGDIAIGVIFGPHELQLASGDPDAHVICGNLRVDGNLLAVSQNQLGRNIVYDTFTFNRPSVDAPYAPTSYRSSRKTPVTFATDPGKNLPPAITTGLTIMSDGAATIWQRMRLPKDNRRRCAPYVRIMDPSE